MRSAHAHALAWLTIAGCGFSRAGASAGDDARGSDVVDAPGSGAFDAGSGGSGSGGSGSAAVDAGTGSSVDAGVGPLVCPSGNGWFEIADTSSHYYASSQTAHWKAAETQCEALQLAGGSAVHLAVLDSPGELDGVAMHDPDHEYWIGMFQQGSQSAPDVGWLWITGGSGLSGHWNTGEPNDDGGLFSQSNVENDDEDFAELHADSASINDESEGTGDRYLCECDGLPVPAGVRALIP